MLADWFFHEQGIRDRVAIIYATPLPGAFTKPITSRHVGDILDRKGVKVVPEFLLEHVDPDAKNIVAFDEQGIECDLLVSVPLNLGISNILGILPGMTAFATQLMKDKMEQLEVPSVCENLQMLVDAGAKLYGCKMSVDMMGLKKEDFIDGVLDVVIAGNFMDMTEGAQVVFI